MSFDHIFKRVFRSDTFRLHLIFRWIAFLMCWGEIRWGQGQRFLVLWPVDLLLSVPHLWNSMTFCEKTCGFLWSKNWSFSRWQKQDHLIPHFPMVISWRKRPTSWLPAKRDTRWELNTFDLISDILTYETMKKGVLYWFIYVETYWYCIWYDLQDDSFD